MGFYGVTDPGQIAWMKPRLTPHPWACFAQKLVLTNEAAMRLLPISFIFSAVQIDNLTDEIRGQIRAFTQGRFWEIDTGHDLMISEPQKTAEALLGIASA